ncbi:hypothetical protein [Coleofasciculus sp.]|uniref:hypothetical protein n=1 Tax=Coleofasciculus sp. TaxID=3100458 RepID=UPI003A2C541A
MGDEQIAQARLAYETLMGRVSDSHWYRVKKILQKHNLEITVKNVQLFADLRTKIPRSAIGVEGILTVYQKVNQILSKSKPLKGSEVLDLLHQYGVKPHQTTISRWFSPLGGFRRGKEYPPEKLHSVFVSALIYKAHFSTSKLPEQVNHG